MKELSLELKKILRSLVHDLKNPINNLGHISSLLMEDYDNEHKRGLFEKISKRELQKVNNLLDSLSSVTMPVNLKQVNTNINDLIDDFLLPYQDEACEKGIKIVKNCNLSDAFATAFIDRASIITIFKNLVDYAFYSMQCGGTLTFFVDVVTDKGKNYLAVNVSDTGIGVPKEDIENAFSDFTNCDKIGIGIKFFECSRIIDAHKGQITVKDNDGGGIIISFSLPAH